MKQEEKEKLEEEILMLRVLLDFHVQNKSYITMGERDFEEYVNAVLDRLNELENFLKEENDRL